jgi:hypothetical protein
MRCDAMIILVLAIFTTGCDNKRPDNIGPPPDLRPLSVLVVGPADIAPAVEVRYTALEIWSDGSRRDVTASALWTSSNPAVLSVSGGLAKGLAPGEVRVSAQVEQLPVNPKGVRVIPARHEWDGLYTLTLGGGACSNALLPLAPELQRRRYTATVRQAGLSLYGNVANVGGFVGQIINPEVRFTLYRARGLSRRVQKASLLGALPLVLPFHLFAPRKVAYSGDEPEFVEVINGHRLVISGEAVTTMSSSGFAGTLTAAVALYEATRQQLLGVCFSSSHEFTLIRK